MTGLWLGIGVLSLLAIAFVLLPAFRASQAQQAPEPVVDRKQQNIDIFQERLAELESERATGNMDQESFDSLKLELEKNLLQEVDPQPEQPKPGLVLTRKSVMTALLLALLVPVTALALYGQFGRAPDLQIALNKPADPFNGRQPTLEEAVTELRKRLAQDPENPEGWYLLGNTLMGSQDFSGAAQGYENALKYLPKDAPQYAGVNGQYAQALFFANGGKLTDQVREEVEKTLALEEYEITALGILGIDAYERADYRAAIGYWNKGLTNASGEQADSLRSGIKSARGKLEAAGESVADLPEIAEVKLQLKVSLDPALQAGVSPDLPVFIFARQIGQRMPLAAVRLTVADLPADVVLDDSLAMTPQARLSSVEEVEVVARISTSGEPKPMPGDLSGTLSPVAVQQQVDILELSIDKVVK